MSAEKPNPRSGHETPAPASYQNWKAQQAGLPLLGRAEIPIYSDVEFSLPPTDGLGPYRFQHAFPAEMHDPALILFVDEHHEFKVAMEKTETRGFTGALLGDELAALLSLAVGRRFMAGEPTRMLSPPTAKDWIIMADRSRPIFFRPTSTRLLGQRAPIIPRATERLELRANQLTTFPHVHPDAATALVRAGRLYRDALWIAETEPELAWLLLVSALEVAAVFHQAELPHVDVLRASKPKLVERLDAIDASLADEVATSLSRELRATARFLAFMMQFLPEPPAKRPPEDWKWTRVDWAPKPMKKALEQIYKLRSLALHEGIPFPPPMSRPPFVGEGGWSAPSETVLGLAAASHGGVWMADELPMSLHTFEFIARGALINWWNSLTTAAPTDGDATATPTTAPSRT